MGTIGTDKIGYKLAKIVIPRDESLKKQWFVGFHIIEISTGVFKQKREYAPMALTKTERHAWLLNMAEQINKMLKSGNIGNPIKPEAAPRLITVIDGMATALAFKKTYISLRSYNTFSQACASLAKWLVKNKLAEIHIQRFNKSLASEYMEQLKISRKIGNTTYNGYLANLKTVFNYFVEKDYIDINPFSKVKALKEVKPELRVWSEAEKLLYANYCKEHEPELYLFSMLVYRCFLRPKEIIELRLADFNLELGIIRVSAIASKNNKHQYVTIPQGLVARIKPLIATKPKDYLMFSIGLKPGPKQIHRNNVTYRFRKVRDKIGLPADVGLYKLKHTGNSELLDSGVALGLLKEQNRHHSLSMTETYAKRLSHGAITELSNLSDL